MTEKIYLFDYRHYKPYLLAVCGGKKMRRGLKAELAKAAQCQPTYISQVLHGKAHLSLEQAERLCRFLKLSKEEAQFFMLLVQQDRAGTKELKEFYHGQIEERIVQRMNVVNRLGATNILSEEDHAVYFSSWTNAAVHVALTVPELRTKSALARYLNLAPERVEAVLDYLVRTGLVKQNGNFYETGTAMIRLGKSSPHIIRHHSHWRQQAIESLERETDRDLHYSAAVTLAKSDVLKIKERLLEEIKETIGLIKESKEEEVYVLNLDFFNLRKSSE